MMYHKVLMFRKYDLADQIMQTNDPAKCKKIAGRRFPEFNSELWEKTCYRIVRCGVRAKFVQNPEILQILLGTGNTLLAECSPYDKKWGIGIGITNPKRLNVAVWPGNNLLGRILMEIREELRQEIRLSPDGKLRYIDARDLPPIEEWNLNAGELKRIPQYYSAVNTYSDTLPSADTKNSFLYDFTMKEWESAMRFNMGGGMPVTGFYEMKQDIYDIARRLHG